MSGVGSPAAAWGKRAHAWMAPRNPEPALAALVGIKAHFQLSQQKPKQWENAAVRGGKRMEHAFAPSLKPRNGTCSERAHSCPGSVAGHWIASGWKASMHGPEHSPGGGGGGQVPHATGHASAADRPSELGAIPVHWPVPHSMSQYPAYCASVHIAYPPAIRSAHLRSGTATRGVSASRASVPCGARPIGAWRADAHIWPADPCCAS